MFVSFDPTGMEACLQRLASLLMPPSGVVPRLLALPLGEDTLVAQLHALWMLQVSFNASRAGILGLCGPSLAASMSCCLSL